MPFQSPSRGFTLAIAQGSVRSLCLSLPFLTLCGPISTAEATRRLSSKIPHRRVPSRFPSRCFSASPGACRPLHLDLCPASAPAPESPSSDRNLTIGLKGPSWPHPPPGSSGSTLWMDLAPACFHLVLSPARPSLGPAAIPSIRKTGKLPAFPTGPALPSSSRSGLCKTQPRGESQPTGPARWALVCPPASSFPRLSFLPLHPSPTGLLLWVYLSHCSFQLHLAQSCFHHLKSCSCPFSHGISAEISLFRESSRAFLDCPYWVWPPTHTPGTVLGSHGPACHACVAPWPLCVSKPCLFLLTIVCLAPRRLFGPRSGSFKQFLCRYT